MIYKCRKQLVFSLAKPGAQKIYLATGDISLCIFEAKTEIDKSFGLREKVEDLILED
jgi:hypothetical protein